LDCIGTGKKDDARHDCLPGFIAPMSLGRKGSVPTDALVLTGLANFHAVASRTLAYSGLLLGEKSGLSGRVIGIVKIAQADANQAKPLLRAEAHTFPQ
jgi:hypothetical protein